MAETGVGVEMPRLRALTSYRHGPRNLRFVAGEEFDATGEMAVYLMWDAPGCFVEVAEIETLHAERRAMDRPPRDKMMRAPGVDK